MKVKMKTTAAGPWGLIAAGKIGIVPDAVGRAMVAARSAVEVVDGAAAPVVAPPIQTATVEAPENQITVDPPSRRRRKHAQMSESKLPA